MLCKRTATDRVDETRQPENTQLAEVPHHYACHDAIMCLLTADGSKPFYGFKC
jgi:hypothetical protein